MTGHKTTVGCVPSLASICGGNKKTVIANIEETKIQYLPIHLFQENKNAIVKRLIFIEFVSYPFFRVIKKYSNLHGDWKSFTSIYTT